MPIGLLTNNKLISIAMQGYNPFQPDCGIYCGSYQGIVYPCPTILISPSTSFKPQDYRDPIASEYTISPIYQGIDIGNPGIDYRNPGHILGLLDTFCRMAYGITILKSIQAGNDIMGDVSPIVDISLPLKNQDLSIFNITPSDIYPSLTEVPSDWLDYFTIDNTGRVTPDIRPGPSFTVGSPYQPATNVVDANALNLLFNNISVFSYFEAIIYLRSLIGRLFEAASELAIQSNSSFTLTNAHHFDKYFNEEHFFADRDELHSGFCGPSEYIISNNSRYMNKCTVISPSHALEVLSGDTEYHNSIIENQYEYRSLAELNSVVNIIPVQSIGGLYQEELVIPESETQSGGGTSCNLFPQSPRSFRASIYSISDIVVNMTSVLGDEQVTIEGIVTAKSLIPISAHYKFTSTFRRPPGGPDAEVVTVILEPSESRKVSVVIRSSFNNRFTWDKAWFDTDLDEGDITIETLDIPYGLSPKDTSDLIVPFSQTFALIPGCNTLRTRIFVKSRNNIDAFYGSFQIKEEDWTDDSDGHLNPGILSCNYVSSPDLMKTSVPSDAISISLTIIPPNSSPINHNFSF